MTTLIKNARLNDQTISILIKDGKITAIDSSINTDAENVFDAHNHQVIPGLVDVHVHFRDPGLTYKETIETGSKASAHGGFTTVFAMPNVKPVVDNPTDFAKMVAKNQADGVIKIKQYAAISGDLTANQVTDIKDMADLGAIGFTNDGHGVQTADTMYQAMKLAKSVNRPIVAHVEDDSLIHGGVMNAGLAADRLGLPGMSSLSESAQLARDLVLANATGVHYHVAHISTKESVELLRIAKARGMNVTAEVSPHHLLLDDSMITMDNPMMKMNPPLRSPEDRAALISGLLDGTIDMVATDHAPHSVEEKQGSMRSASFGIVGIETAFSLIYTHFVKSGLVDLQTALDWMVTNPIKAFGLHDAGQLRVGDAADLVIMDLDHEFNIDAADFLSKGKNSPFIGDQVYGKTIATFVSGKQVY
ncbi:dihydroorotase [Lactobacillus sp. Sy-1]|uniref:dihydroorotase n=1 Tax=Lactobacillus sp. Sy-1 TaxID=2109645 RepID=UPI001C57B19C|nr:dihydroorotase [Lactobacillus sp. Sy-1]MBW1605656.1 dihydroorotase [Lactobacillus sp. Sy-1]